jgi:hypothetical protein
MGPGAHSEARKALDPTAIGLLIAMVSTGTPAETATDWSLQLSAASAEVCVCGCQPVEYDFAGVHAIERRTNVFLHNGHIVYESPRFDIRSLLGRAVRMAAPGQDRPAREGAQL